MKTLTALIIVTFFLASCSDAETKVSKIPNEKGTALIISYPDKSIKVIQVNNDGAVEESYRDIK